MATPYTIGEQLPISLDPAYLPAYGLRTVLRMLIAMLFSLLFTLIFGTWAAKSTRAEKIIIPAIDVLQSVPVLGFLSIAVIPLIALFPGSLLGPEAASIFAVFTSQAWNMVLGFYQTVRSVPHEMRDAADLLHLSSWQRFWRIEVPFSMPGLLWNSMLSMSASWFFVVASEAISASNQEISLPGIGSYIALAIDNKDIHAVFYAIFAMLIVILIYDQLLFRPLMKWSEKFKLDSSGDERVTRSWFITLMQRSYFVKYSGRIFTNFTDAFINHPLFNRNRRVFNREISERKSKRYNFLWNSALVLLLLAVSYIVLQFVVQDVSRSEIQHVIFLGLATTIRVAILIVVASLIWIPIGVWIGTRPRLRSLSQPVVQFLAAFPANLFFPIVVVAIVRFNLNVEIWTTPLMILGSQWYILFNVIAGASTLPKELYQVATNFQVTGWQWWRRLILPGIFPYYITGAITAAGAAWNASILAEVVSWGDTTLKATGLGGYITEYTTSGDFPRIALGIGMMCIFVLLFNRLFWRPLYILSERFQME